MDIPRPLAHRWDDIADDLPFAREELLADAHRLNDHWHVKAVYAGGSRVDGYGNTRSDLDLYALVEDPVGPPRHDGYVVSLIRGQPIQYDIVTIAFVDQALTQLLADDLDNVQLSATDLKVLHRLVHAVPLLGETILEQCRDRLVQAGFARLCAYRKVAQSLNGLQDAYGAWESRQLETTVYTVRSTVQYALDAVLCLLGETANNDKWIFPRSVRALGAAHPLSLSFRRHYRGIPDSEQTEDVARYLQDALGLAQTCLDTWFATWLEREHTPVHGLGPVARHVMQHSGTYGVKTPHVFLRRLRDKTVLFHRGRPARELSDRAAALWLCLQGETAAPQALAEVACTLASTQFPDLDGALALAERLLPAWSAAGYLV